MSDNTKTIRIKWVRSGIGFSHYQKTIVRSLGLRYLNQIVVRPDTPQMRGVVASVPHLLAIVPEAAPPAWASIPEYTITERPEPKSVPPSRPSEAEASSRAGDETVSTVKEAAEAEVAEPEAPARPKKAAKAAKKPVAKKAKPADAKAAKPKKAAKK